MPQETVRDKINLAIKAHLAGGMPRIGEEFALTDDIISSISKLILEAVGSDKDMSKENSHDCLYRLPLLDGQKMPEREYINYDQRRGYNQAKAEIREALRKVGIE
jgi:hypothetical protein